MTHAALRHLAKDFFYLQAIALLNIVDEVHNDSVPVAMLHARISVLEFEIKMAGRDDV